MTKNVESQESYWTRNCTEVLGVKFDNQRQMEFTSFYRSCKRVTDITGAILGIILFSPMLLILPVLVKLDAKGPVIHKRRVSGKDNIFFYFYKFRTIIDSADELPQFFNVVKGEIKTVEPRPIVEEEKNKYDSRDLKRRFIVEPGIARYWQLNAKNEVDYQE